MTLSVDIGMRLGDFALDAAFTSDGRLTALFGPSGSGKTSLVNAIAGLVRPARGRIEVDGRVLLDTGRGIVLPPHRRRIGYVFQDARLFPHLTVAQNLGYGRLFAPRGERTGDLAAVVDLLGIAHLLGRRPAALSGGEKQRVAIGRALLSAPRLILMDEPLAALDEARKAEIIPYVERLRDEAGIPIVYVSHALAEVSRLATDIVVLDACRVTAHGPADVVLAGDALAGAGADAFALVGMQVVSHDHAFGLTLLRSSAGEWRLPRVEAPAGARVRARIRAGDVMIATEPPRGISALNVVAGRVESVRETDTVHALVRIASGSDRLLSRVTRRSVDVLGLREGVRVHAVVKSVVVESMPMYRADRSGR